MRKIFDVYPRVVPKVSEMFRVQAFEGVIASLKKSRDLLRACLSEGYEVIETQEPEQALGLALEHQPDAILLDLMMPKFSA